jgi:hypothetical protein
MLFLKEVRLLYGVPMMRTVILGLLVSLAAVAAMSQAPSAKTDTAPPPSARFPASWYPADSRNTYTEAPVTGVPYSATMVTTYTLPPSITPPRTGLVQRDAWYRDSRGRTRKEQSRGSSYKSPDGVLHEVPMVHEIEVNDPVSHCRFNWVEPWTGAGEPSATVSCMPRVVQYSGGDSFSYILKQEARVDSMNRTEPLGKMTLEGFEVYGMRNTKTLQTTTAVFEFWYSPQLHELLRFGPVPPAPGVPTFEMKNIHLGEPNPDLFYPPSNYRIDSGRQ